MKKKKIIANLVIENQKLKEELKKFNCTFCNITGYDLKEELRKATQPF